MRRTSGSIDTNGDPDLFGRLRVFVDQWKSFNGTEQAGAQQFLQGLLDSSVACGGDCPNFPARVS